MSQLKERLITFVNNNSGAGSISEFEKNCGITIGTISKKDGNLRTDILAKIARRYPLLDLYWVLGLTDVPHSPLSVKSDSEGNTTYSQDDKDMIEFLKDQLIHKDEMITFLKDIIKNQ